MRDYALFRGEFPDEEVVAEFEANYNEQERRDVLAVITIMGFANKTMNTVTGDVLAEPQTAGDLPRKKEKK